MRYVSALFFWFACNASAAVLTAATCSYSDVNTQLAAAAVNDTIKVPAGSCTWSSTLNITKGVRLLGAGIGQTNITAGTTPIINYTPSNPNTNAPIRIAGFTFKQNNQTGNLLSMTSGNTSVQQTKLRIDHNRFEGIPLGSTQDHYIYFECMRGVIDSNSFGTVFYPFRAPTSCNPDGGRALWERSTSDAVELGATENNLWFEDNTFDNLTDAGGVIMIDCQEGGRYAFRYNSISMSQSGQPLFDMHGNQGSGFYGCTGGEIYGNTLSGSGVGGTFLDHRGGRAFVYLNQGAGFNIQVREEFADSLNTVTGGGIYGGGLQHVNGSYYWGNRVSATGALWSWSINTECSQCFENGLAAGVDFFTPDSSPGITSGTLANRPGTCSVGQGYWATTQSTTNLTGMVGPNPSTPIRGTLYRCVSANTWDSGKSPLKYPHPLRAQLGDSLRLPVPPVQN